MIPVPQPRRYEMINRSMATSILRERVSRSVMMIFIQQRIMWIHRVTPRLSALSMKVNRSWSKIILCLRSISRVAQKPHCIHDFALILGFLSRTKSFRRVDSLLKHIPHQDLSFLWIGAKFRFPVQVKKISDEWIRFKDILPHQNPEHCHYSSNECDGWNGVQCLARQHSQEREILEKSCCDRRSAKA